MLPEALAEFFNRHSRLLVITGAGCSINSGIPAYRDRDGNWQRSEPIQHHDFLTRHVSRQRYWARSMAGWPHITNAKPNRAHQHLARLEQLGKISLLVTQNVDRLHQRAGHRNVIDLHGRLDRVHCLSCGRYSSRAALQNRLLSMNPHLPDVSRMAPDGDADIVMDFTSIEVPVCTVCEGILKPDVVFYGGAVDRKVVQVVCKELNNVDGLLIVGSSLMVFSGYRFCKRAHELNKPMACINPGKTRADDMFEVKVEADCISTLDLLMAVIEPDDNRP